MMKRYDKYKDPKIEWIGEIPEEWRLKKISHGFRKIGSGTTPTAGNQEYYLDGVYNWLQTGDLTNGAINSTSKKITKKALEDFSTLRFYKPGSLVIAMYGATIGKVGLLNIETTTNQACCVLSEPDSFETRYVYYWFTANKDNVISLGYGGGQPNISQDIIKSLKLPCPTLEEQNAITTYLDNKIAQIDTLIDNKQSLIELLKEERTAIINEAVSGKGKNWEEKKLKYVAKLKSGNGITADDIRPEGDYPVYGGNGLRGYTSTYTHEGNFVLIGRQGALCGNINYAKEKFFASEHAVVATILEGSEFIWLGELLRSMNLNQYSIASAQPGLSVERIQNISIPVPPKEEQIKIVEYIKTETEELDNTIFKIEKEIELMQEYRIAVISEVVTGKIKVI